MLSKKELNKKAIIKSKYVEYFLVIDWFDYKKILLVNYG